VSFGGEKFANGDQIGHGPKTEPSQLILVGNRIAPGFALLSRCEIFLQLALNQDD
jgi:hypothetical protein